MHPMSAAAATIVVTLLVLSLPTETTPSPTINNHTTTTYNATTSTDLTNCSQPFSCGHLQNLTYPFSGGARPSYCGLPELQLTCQNGTALLNLDSLVYLVNEVNQTTKTMSLSRLDLYNTTCTTRLLDTALDGAVLSLTPNNVNLTLFYACNGSWNDKSSGWKPANLFSCDINGSPSDAYYLIGPVPQDPILDLVQCNLTLRVPMLANRVAELEANRSLLGEILREGFEASYGGTYSEDECEACLRRSGGECGFDPGERRVVCICGDRLCADNDSKNVSLPIGLAIGGAAIFGLFLGGWFCLLAQRRKRKSAAENQSKEQLSPSPINQNKNVHIMPVDLSMSIPPYPYSNSNSNPKSDLPKGSTYFGVQVFSLTELEEATDNFDHVKELGSGGFGTVYHGILRDGRSVAVKRLFDNSMKREEQFMNEVEILNRLRHRNLVTLYGCTSRRTRELIFVYEYVPNGTVADHIHGDQSKSSFLPWPIRLSIAIETADALAYLHTSDVIHRDVKTNNILLDNNFHVKVADFGLSRLFPNNVTHVSTAPQGTPGYVDPEYYHTYQLTDKSDVYSFGVVLMELISSLPAVDTNRHRHAVNLASMTITKIQSGSITELIDPLLGSDKDNTVRKMATSIAELAFRCLQQEREMRPTMNEVYQALKKIQNENCPTGKCETMVEIREDDVSPLKQVSPPLSPDSTETSQWISSSTLSSS